MQSDVKQVFYFHSDASSIGGFLEEPFRHIPTPCSVSLSSSGGHTSDSVADYGFEDGIKVRSAYTHVRGEHAEKNGPWRHRVVSVVEGLDIFGRFTAEKVIAQMFIEHPKSGGGPRKISFAGSRFDDARLDGKPIKIILNDALLPEQDREVDAYNQDTSFNPDLEWPALFGHAKRQSGVRSRTDGPAWAKDRFSWIEEGPENGEVSSVGYTLCSLVDKIEGVETGQAFGHCIEVPDFGRLFLAEVTILPHSAYLSMFRAELGCAVTGQITAGGAGSNGTTMPPS